MLKTKLKGIPFKFSGETIAKGTTLEFKAVKPNGKDWNIKDVQGIKVLSIFPDINTKICDIQTRTIAQLADEYKDISFISISLDNPEVQAEWCAAKDLKNISIVSDVKYREFGRATNLYIPKIKKLGRGLIVLDNNNEVIDLFINKELTVEPDYSKLKKYFK